MQQIENLLNTTEGQPIEVTPDLIVLSDNLPLAVVSKLANLKPKYPEKLVVVNCYDVPSGSFESSEIQKQLIAFAKKYDLAFEQADGVLYDTLRSHYVKPGMVVITSGMHNAVFGSVGALGLELDSSQLEELLTSGTITVKQPLVQTLNLVGELPDQVYIKDFAIRLATQFKDQLQDVMLKVGGSALTQLTELEKRDLFQLFNDCGVLTAIQTDDVTKSYFTIDLGETVRMVALPGSLQNGVPLSDFEMPSLQACLIGGATGSSIEDLRIVAQRLKKQRVPFEMRLTISPETSAVYDQAIEEGLIQIFIDANAQIIAPGYGSIARPSKAVVGAGEAQLATGYWNYVGYNGNEDSKTYVVSTLTAIENALKVPELKF